MKNEQKLLDLLSSRSTVFEIAKYQRNYSWNNSNWEELWIDVERMINMNGGKHFLNTVITFDNKRTGTVEIVDGQQRIITFLQSELQTRKSI